MKVDLSGVTTPQLIAIKKILMNGVEAMAGDTSQVDRTSVAAPTNPLCHTSPPKGYPSEKSQYGDPACYRYPLNTKARCLAAWRYVHQKDNKKLLAGKAESVISKIKSYAKEHYKLDLEESKAEAFDWEQIFLEYYDGETMGERCSEIVLEPDGGNMENEEATKLKTDLDAKVKEVDALTAEVSELKKGLADLTKSHEDLKKFKETVEEAEKRAVRMKNIKTKLEEAKLDTEIEADAEYWLGMSDEVLVKTITKMSDLAKKAVASAEKAKAPVKVPPAGGSTDDTKLVVSEALKARKAGK